MLYLALKHRETIIIDPKEGLDPTMTVAELFKDGPICIEISKVHEMGKKVLLGVQAPLELRVLRHELIAATHE